MATRKPCLCYKIQEKTTFCRHQDKQKECAILRPNPSKVSLFIFSAKTPKMTGSGPKKVPGFPMKTPIFHIAPISRTYPPPPISGHKVFISGEGRVGVYILSPTVQATFLTCFHACFFPFCLLCWPPLFLPILSAPFRPFLPLEQCSFL